MLSHLKPIPQGFSLILATILLLAGCTQYDIKVNERLVYSPDKLFTDFRVSDPALQNCLDQSIKDQSIMKASSLSRLSCSNAGIRELEGIKVFSQLKEVNLRGNKLESIQALASLSELRLLLLSDNQLQEANALLNLLKLEEVSLSGNPDLRCRELDQFAEVSEAKLARPSHCVP